MILQAINKHKNCYHNIKIIKNLMAPFFCILGAPIIIWVTLQVKPFNQVKIRQSIGFCVGEATLFFMWDHLSKLLDNRYINIDRFE